MLYATELPEGFVRVTWPSEGEGGNTHGIAFTFDPRLVTAVTTFATFGGWRNLQTILPEAGVGYPADLRDAVSAGTSGCAGGGADRGVRGAGRGVVRTPRQPAQTTCWRSITPSGTSTPGHGSVRCARPVVAPECPAQGVLNSAGTEGY